MRLLTEAEKRARATRAFGYDAIKDDGRRKSPPVRLVSEDRELTPQQRAKLLTNGRVLQQNSTDARWMVNKHLDFVSTFTFQATAKNDGDDALAEQVESLMEWFSEPENCDIAGRHSLKRIMRLSEARKTVDGDMLLLKLKQGKLQAVEGDRIVTPSQIPEGYEAKDFDHGVLTDEYGKAKKFAVSKRNDSGGFVFERLVDAEHAILHAHYDRLDQVRGISPMASALNDIRDRYEARGYALGKMKVSQLFGLTVYKTPDSTTDIPLEEDLGAGATDADAGEDESDDDDSEPKYKFTPNAINLLEMDAGERAEFLESKNPSTEFQSFDERICALALKALDIPYCFYDEAYTNYSGIRAALLLYDASANIKRESNQAVLNNITRWRIQLWIEDGVLPEDTLERISFVWIPTGLPWMDQLKEITADILAIDAGLDNPEDVCTRHGGNFYTNILKRKRCEKFAKDNGVALSTQTLPTVIQEPAEQPSNGQTKAR